MREKLIRLIEDADLEDYQLSALMKLVDAYLKRCTKK